MSILLRFACCAALAAGLAACNSEQPEKTTSAAAVEVLPASVSDEMLPLDTVQSQPPLAPVASRNSGSKTDGSGSSGRATGASEQKEASPAAAEPAKADSNTSGDEGAVE